MDFFLDEIVQAQKKGEARGIPSICSAHPWVLKTALQGDEPVLLEATCNQVNQYGGYTGKTARDFYQFVMEVASQVGFPREKIILGGDHLGPSPWQQESSETAMRKAEELVQSYVMAGFAKIHLDASMRLADDPPGALALEQSARRTARLAKIAETVANPETPPRYVIGSEVPIPGGATEHEQAVSVTRVEDTRRTLEITREAFKEEGLESAWERVIALVVQPGVEFGDDFILPYNPGAASSLAQFSTTTPLVYEAHSTDYQSPGNLQALVKDHFAILKVGPALTFAYREALFALEMIERELIPPKDCSRLAAALDDAMLRNPVYWKKHYHGSPADLAFARKYSLSDRCRYYWTDPGVQVALGKLLDNLKNTPLPLSLISQYLPDVYDNIRSGEVTNSAAGMVSRRIDKVLGNYRQACYKPGAESTFPGNK
jgi:D-tagatose-1,6-bisphosphate aldolase subunit GatZ/KbaZ